MNYATDRLDRRSRSRSGIDGLFRDFQDAWRLGDHTRLAHVALCKGTASSCRGAEHHAAVAWSRDPDNPLRAGDYAQICEMNGLPELGMLALWCFRCRGRLKRYTDCNTGQEIENSSASRVQISAMTCKEWMEDSLTCGCRLPSCGSVHGLVPMEPEALQQTYLELRDYLSHMNDHATRDRKILTAHQVLMKRAKGEQLGGSDGEDQLPPRLRFWELNALPNARPFPAVLQTLMTKLLYLLLPGLASHSLLYSAPPIMDDKRIKAEMVQTHKSHMAYFVLIDALVFGSPHALVKPGRRHSLPYFHVPIHDQMFGLDARRDFAFGRRRNCLEASEDGCSTRKVSNKEDASSAEGIVETYAYSNSMIHAWLEKLDRVVRLAESPHASSLHSPPSHLAWLLPKTCPNSDSKPLYIVGDSHILSLAWQVIQLESGEFRRIVPVVVTGLKAWHVRRETRFFTRVNLEKALIYRLQGIETVLFSAGEIDCREGLGGPLLEGYEADTALIADHVEHTVREYVRALEDLVADQRNTLKQVLVLPVAPHAAKATSRVVGQASRRETTRTWNQALRKLLPTKNIYYLDYSDKLVDETKEAYTLLRMLDADSTHMNAGFAPLLEQGIVTSGCAAHML